MLSTALLAVVLAAAPSPTTIPLWPAGAPGEPSGVGAEHEQPLKPGDNTIRLTDVTQPTLTIYRPEKPNKACVMICPGGGYNILAWNKEGTEVAEWLNSLGVTAAILKYRVPVRKDQPRHAAPLQDAQRALGLLRHRAEEMGIDPARIGVLGFSAGGHLAACLSNSAGPRTYKEVDPADKVACRPDFAILIYPAYLATKENQLSPELKVDAQTPKTFIAMTQDDAVRVEGALTYYQALKAAKVPGEMHLYSTGGHGYGLRPSKNAVSSWPLRAAEWMRSLDLLQ